MRPLAFMEWTGKVGGELVNQREGRSRSKSRAMIQAQKLDNRDDAAIVVLTVSG